MKRNDNYELFDFVLEVVRTVDSNIMDFSEVQKILSKNNFQTYEVKKYIEASRDLLKYLEDIADEIQAGYED